MKEFVFPRTGQLIYLDESDIDSLYAQTVGLLEIKRTTRIGKTQTSKTGEAAKLQNLLLKILGARESETSRGTSGLQKPMGGWKGTRTAERRLDEVVASLRRTGRPVFFSNLALALKAVRSRAKVFVCLTDTFDAPQFAPNGGGVAGVNHSCCLVLEKRQAYDYGDDYYRKPQLDRPITIAANVAKMRRPPGKISATGNALLFKRNGGRDIPLEIFGIMAITSDHYEIKPYAIWH